MALGRTVRLLLGIAGIFASTAGAYYLLLFYAANNWRRTPLPELATEIYLIELFFSIIILIVFVVSIRHVLQSIRN